MQLFDACPEMLDQLVALWEPTPPPPPKRPRTGRAATVRDLTLDDCVGRRAIAPQSMWPAWRCREHGGAGWEVLIDAAKPDGTVRVSFVASTGSRSWRPMWLQLSSLEPLR